jgi:hypothetical protein
MHTLFEQIYNLNFLNLLSNIYCFSFRPRKNLSRGGAPCSRRGRVPTRRDGTVGWRRSRRYWSAPGARESPIGRHRLGGRWGRWSEGTGSEGDGGARVTGRRASGWRSQRVPTRRASGWCGRRALARTALGGEAGAAAAVAWLGDSGWHM